AEYERDARLAQKVVIMRRNNASGHHQDVVPPEVGKRFYQFRQQGFVASCEAGHTHDVNVVLNSLSRHFLRCLEQRADVDIETDIGKACSDHASATIVAILSDFGDEYARTTSFLYGKIVRQLPGLFQVGMIFHNA